MRVWDIDKEGVCGFRFRVERPCSRRRCVFVFNILQYGSLSEFLNRVVGGLCRGVLLGEDTRRSDCSSFGLLAFAMRRGFIRGCGLHGGLWASKA